MVRWWWAVLLLGTSLVSCELLVPKDTVPREEPQEAAPAWPSGATWLGEGQGTQFLLYAPGQTSVSVRGTFNDWGKTPMSTDGKGTFWTVADAQPGGSYKFWWASGAGEAWIPDPYTRLVSDDTYGGVNSVIVGGEGDWGTEYPWTDGAFVRPERESLVLYEMHALDFSRNTSELGPDLEESFAGVAARADYLSGLGVNAVELMPVTDWPGTWYSWGYNPLLFFALSDNLATDGAGAQVIRDYKGLVNTLHGRNIAVIMDVVYNHTEGIAPLAVINKAAFYKTAATPWGPALDETKPWVKQHLIDNLVTWARDFHVDGFRLDFTAGMDIDTLFSIVEAVEAQGFSDLYWIFEEFNGSHNQKIQAYNTRRGKAVVSSWGTGYKNEVWGALGAGAADLGRVTYFSKDDGWDRPGSVVNYVSSHDEGTLKGHLGSTAAEVRLAYTHLLTSLGIPMVWMGDETMNVQYGNHPPTGISGVDKQYNQVNWDAVKVAGSDAQGTHDYLAAMIKLRIAQPSLRRTDANPDTNGASPADGFAWNTRWSDTPGLVGYALQAPGERAALVLINYAASDRTLAQTETSVPVDGAWSLVADSALGAFAAEGIADRGIAASGGQVTGGLTVPAKTALVYLAPAP